MSKPNTLKDLLSEGHIALGEIRKIARDIFNGTTTGAGPEGYLITAVDFDKLPAHVQGFIIKAILEFKVENVLERRAADGQATLGDIRCNYPLEEGDNFKAGNPDEDDYIF